MKKVIKQGGCYQLKNKEGWLIVGVKKDYRGEGYYQCQEIYVDDEFYDETIRDLDEEDIRELANLEICYRPYYHKKLGLYKVWDESKPKSAEITLQKITR